MINSKRPADEGPRWKIAWSTVGEDRWSATLVCELRHAAYRSDPSPRLVATLGRVGKRQLNDERERARFWKSVRSALFQQVEHDLPLDRIGQLCRRIASKVPPPSVPHGPAPPPQLRPDSRSSAFTLPPPALPDAHQIAFDAAVRDALENFEQGR